MVAAIYNLFTKTATYKNSIEFEKVGKSIDDDTAILKVVVATGRSIDSAIKKFKLPSRDAVRSKQVTEFLQDELNIR